MASQWFYRIMGEELGPISSRQLLAMAQSGELRIDDLVRKHVNGHWVRAENVVGLFDTPSLPVVASKSIAVIHGLGSSWGHEPGCAVLEKPPAAKAVDAKAADAQATRVHARSRPGAIAMTLREIVENAARKRSKIVVPLRVIGARKPLLKAKPPVIDGTGETKDASASA